jgi:thioesterase domain-containing protein
VVPVLVIHLQGLVVLVKMSPNISFDFVDNLLQVCKWQSANIHNFLSAANVAALPDEERAVAEAIVDSLVGTDGQDGMDKALVATHVRQDLYSKPAWRKSNCIPLLLRSNERSPVFLTHGSDSEPGPLIQVAEANCDRSIYAFKYDQTPNDYTEPINLEETVARYIGSIKRIQPEGPYNLVGFCDGAVMACIVHEQLVFHGESIAFIGAIDGRPPTQRGQTQGQLEQYLVAEQLYEFAQRFSSMDSLDASDMTSEALLEAVTKDLSIFVRLGICLPEESRESFINRNRLKGAFWTALEDYRFKQSRRMDHVFVSSDSTEAIVTSWADFTGYRPSTTYISMPHNFLFFDRALWQEVLNRIG